MSDGSNNGDDKPSISIIRADSGKEMTYYAEESFKGADLSRHVHLGWGVLGGSVLIMGCMAMSAMTQNRSWNVSFLWLQRRVGAQFGTLSYMITDNLFHYHDGEKWVHRDLKDVFSRWSRDKPGGKQGRQPSLLHGQNKV
jgi:hypothetical protein